MVSLEDYGSYETAWCPGCGNFAILKAMKQALVQSGLEPHQVLLVSGIGQAAKAPHYLNANVFEWEGGIPIGVLYREDKPVFGDQFMSARQRRQNVKSELGEILREAILLYQ